MPSFQGLTVELFICAAQLTQFSPRPCNLRLPSRWSYPIRRASDALFPKGRPRCLGPMHETSYIVIHRHAIQYYPILSEYIKIVLDSFDTLWISMTLAYHDIYIYIHIIYIYPLHVRTFMIILCVNVCACLSGDAFSWMSNVEISALSEPTVSISMYIQYTSVYCIYTTQHIQYE